MTTLSILYPTFYHLLISENKFVRVYAAKLEGVEIGVITPYARQVKDVKPAIKDTKLDVEVKSVDGFSGRYKKAKDKCVFFFFLK